MLNHKNQETVLIISLASPQFNYGGVLQSSVLWETLERKNYTARVICRKDSSGFGLMLREIISFFVSLNFLKKFSLRKLRTIAFDMPNFRARNSWMETVSLIGWTGRISKRAMEYEMFLVGSDQVFRSDYFDVNISTLRFLGDLENKTRIAYAASFGKITNENLKWLEEDVYRQELSKFSEISIRESSTVSLLRKEYHLETVQISDPCFLFTKNDYVEKFNIEISKNEELSKFVFVYTIQLEEAMEKIILNCPLRQELVTSRPISAKQDQLIKTKQSIVNLGKPLLPEFLSKLANSSLVVTDSYHGVVLSIIFERDFVVVLNEERGSSRVYDLLGKFDLKSRILTEAEAYPTISLTPINWGVVSEIRESEKRRGNEFLLKNLISRRNA